MRWLKNIVTLLIMLLFLTFSSGLCITIHHCCHEHHHAAGDHSHCHTNTFFFKITDQFDFSHSTQITPDMHEIAPLFTNFVVENTENVVQTIIKIYHFTPPLLLLEGRHFFEMIPQRVFYC